MDIFDLMDDDSLNLNKEKLHTWESILDSPIIQNNTKETILQSNQALQYKGDFYGLLHNVLNIPNVAYYINLRLNGLRSPVDYNGDVKIRILNPDIFELINDFLQLRDGM